MKKSGNKDMEDKYKKLKHQVQKELRHSYWEYIEEIVTPKADDNNFSNMKKFWTYIKSKKTDYNGVSSLKQEGKLITDPREKGRDLTQSYDKSPYTNRNVKRAK